MNRLTWDGIKSYLSITEFGYADNLDGTIPAEYKFVIPNDITKILDVKMDVTFNKYKYSIGAGITETTYPASVHVYVDGVDHTTALGGTWSPGASPNDVIYRLDLTPWIITTGVIHVVKFTSSQQGRVCPIIRVRGVTKA
jgi:hypothetical protein